MKCHTNFTYLGKDYYKTISQERAFSLPYYFSDSNQLLSDIKFQGFKQFISNIQITYKASGI
jgi:hypothetical protein